MNILNEIDVYDLEGVASRLKEYGDACVVWKKGWTASFRWMPSKVDFTSFHREDILWTK